MKKQKGGEKERPSRWTDEDDDRHTETALQREGEECNLLKGFHLTLIIFYLYIILNVI